MKIHNETYVLLSGWKERLRSNGKEPSFDDVIMFLADRKARRMNGRCREKVIDNGPAFWGFDAPTFKRRR